MVRPAVKDLAMTGDEILNAARAQGAEVTRRQLKRWRQDGLLPRPDWQHEDGLSGSRSLYPAWTVDQVVEIWRRRQKRRRTAELLIGLWWDGSWVDRSALREALCAPLERLSHHAQEITRCHQDPYEAADALIEVAEREAANAGGLGLVGRRLRNRADTRTVMHTFFLVGLGVEPEWETQDVGLPVPEPSVAELVSRGTGIERAQRDRLGTDPPWLSEAPDVQRELYEMRAAGLFDLLDLGGLIRHASDVELDDARDAARAFSRFIAPAADALEAEFGRDIGGLGSIAELANTADEPGQPIWLVRLMLAARRLLPPETFEALAAAGAPASPTAADHPADDSTLGQMVNQGRVRSDGPR